MYEFASRPSELLNMKIKGVRFYDNYCEITTHGKTGVKTLALGNGSLCFLRLSI
ncbi:MAG: hypothetical protein KatS3mg003_2266 [Candidatus Nitrosocaldaceae archaeon]|nr:MAG: hypothetical protein KatS3mg003_2266 [Candidatus Nitrosocaldaceae archaeon]